MQKFDVSPPGCFEPKRRAQDLCVRPEKDDCERPAVCLYSPLREAENGKVLDIETVNPGRVGMYYWREQ